MEEGDHIIHHAAIQQFHSLGRLVGVVRRQDHLLTGEQRMIGGERLGVEDWIVERTGIRERRIAEPGGTSDLIVPAPEPISWPQGQ